LPPLKTASAARRSYNVSLNGNHYHNSNHSQLISDKLIDHTSIMKLILPFGDSVMVESVTQSQDRFAVNDFSDDSDGCCERRIVEELLGTNVFIAVYMICLIDIYGPSCSLG